MLCTVVGEPALPPQGWDAEADAEENARLFYLVHLFQWFEAHRPKVADLEACPVALPAWREAAERAPLVLELPGIARNMS